MIELQHHNEPESLIKYRRDNPNVQWGEDDFWPVKKEIRHTLHTEQEGLCVYCEKEIGQNDGHVEHVKPKGKPEFSALTFAFDNLAHSCDSSEHCGHFKKNHILPIEPCPGCNRYFELMTRDGKLVPASGLNENEKKQAKDTLCVLGLNTSAIARQRQQFAMIIQSFENLADIDIFLQQSPFRWVLQGV